jgi:hypothetical protein
LSYHSSRYVGGALALPQRHQLQQSRSAHAHTQNEANAVPKRTLSTASVNRAVLAHLVDVVSGGQYLRAARPYNTRNRRLVQIRPENRVMRDLVIEIKPAEPAIC